MQDIKLAQMRPGTRLKTLLDFRILQNNVQYKANLSIFDTLIIVENRFDLNTASIDRSISQKAQF
jgi:hypothetical protein